MKVNEILELINSDLAEAFTMLSKYDWGHQLSNFKQLRQDFVDPPEGMSISDLRAKLRVLVATQFDPTNPLAAKNTRNLTPDPFIPEVFLGREDDLQRIHQHFFESNENLLLLSGQGGIGKTSTAAKYWEKHKHQYSHVAWIFVSQSLLDSLLTLALPLKLEFPAAQSNEDRVKLLLTELNNLDRPCLLVLDNTNNLEQLRNYYQLLRACGNFHLLLTSRITEFEQIELQKLQALQPQTAYELFKHHYPKCSVDEQQLLEKILQAVGYNTLVIELLAKNLKRLNRLRNQYSLDDLLRDLQGQGVLDLRQSNTVPTVYQAPGLSLREEKPEDIIAAMYDLGDLSPEENRYLAVLAVLPAESISFEQLEVLLPDEAEMDQHLLNLSQKGWIELNEGDAFKISPVVQRIVRKKHEALREDCQELIDALNELLTWEGSGHYDDYQEVAVLVRYAAAVVECFEGEDIDISILCERVGKFHEVTGNLTLALYYFQKFHQINQTLSLIDSEDNDYKENQAISSERLGSIYSSLGNLLQALNYFKEENDLFKQLCEDAPDTVNYIEGLAVSYSQLGQVYMDLGKLESALVYFEQYHQLQLKLHEEFPEDEGFKNNLAISFSQLGQVHKELGKLQTALQLFEHNHRLRLQLHDNFPENVSHKNRLASSYSNLGQTHADLGNLQKSLIFFELDVNLSKQLYESFPENVEYKNNLAISYERLGQINADLGKLQVALQLFEQYNQLVLQLFQDFPENVLYKNNLANSYEKLGQTNADLGKLQVALQFFEQDNQLALQLYQDSPENVLHKSNLAISYSKLGMMQIILDNFHESIPYLELHNEYIKELHDLETQNIHFSSSYAESLTIGILLKKLQGEDISLEELSSPKISFDELHQKSGTVSYAKKSAIIAQMQAPGADLRALIIEFLRF